MWEDLSVLGVALLVLALPATSASVVDESANATVPEPANQTANATVLVAENGSATLNLTLDGDVANESAQLVLPDDVVGLVEHVIGVASGLVSDAVDLAIAICDAVYDALTPHHGQCL